MSCPFLREQPVAEGARIIRRAFRINRVLQHRQDPLAQRDNVLLERYRFSHEGVIYIINLLEPHIKSFDSSESGFNHSTNCVHRVEILCEWHFHVHYWGCGELGQKCCLSCHS